MIFQCSHFVGFVVCNVITGPNRQPSIMNSRLKKCDFHLFFFVLYRNKTSLISLKNNTPRMIQFKPRVDPTMCKEMRVTHEQLFSVPPSLCVNSLSAKKSRDARTTINQIVSLTSSLARGKKVRKKNFFPCTAFNYTRIFNFFLCRQHLYLIDCLRQWKGEASTKFHICNISCCHLPPVSRFILI